MTDVNVSIAANSDDGHCTTSGGGFSATGTYAILGDLYGTPYRGFFRFDPVAIPSGATITAAILRMVSTGNLSGTVCNLNVYLEDADDPSQHASGADVIGRSLTSAVAWDAVAAGTTGGTFDTPDLSSILQDVIDRPGWATGQAIVVHIVDNGSDYAAWRQGASLENTTHAEPELRVSYELGTPAPTEESFSMSDAVDGELPGIGETDESFSVQDVVDGLNTSAPMYDFFVMSAVLDAQFESYPVTAESMGFSDDVEAYTELASEGADSFAFRDGIDALNFSDWLRLNLSKAKQRFFLTLTGAADLVADVEISISSVFARKNSGTPTYLQVVVPDFSQLADISARINGDLVLDMGYEVNGVVALREQVLTVDLEAIDYYKGGENRSVVLTGHRTTTYKKQAITIDEKLVSYSAVQNNIAVFRVATVDMFLNAGDTVNIGADSFTANSIVYIINENRSEMELREV
jgi:hypothetical protein